MAIGTVTLQFSCAPTPEPRLQIGQAYAINGNSYQPHIQPNYKEVGLASWYGTKFHRRKTANGDVFDKNAFTAAHKTLPLPSVVRVTNMNNGRHLDVIVNDRGPFVRGRIIDVSESAARELGFWGKGTAKVMVELNREASLALLKDPNLRVSEAVKKQIVEAYTNQNMYSSTRSQGSQTRLSRTDPVILPLENNVTPANPKFDTLVANPLPTQPITQPEKKTSVVTSNQQLKAVNPVSMQKITLVRKPIASMQQQPAVAPKIDHYSIQVASTTSENDAIKISSRLKNLSSKIQKANVNGKTYYRVHVTGLGAENAKLALNTIKAEGFKDAFVFKSTE